MGNSPQLQNILILPVAFPFLIYDSQLICLFLKHSKNDSKGSGIRLIVFKFNLLLYVPSHP